MSLPVAILTPETAGSVGPMRFYLLSGTRLKEISARIGRTKTLDGGVHYDHRGLTDGDRTIQLRTRITRTQTESIRGLMALGERFYLAVKEAVWVGHIAKIDDNFGDATIEFWPHSRLGDASTIEYPDAFVSYSVSISGLDGLSYRSSTLSADRIVIENNGKGAARWVSTIPQGATILSAYATLTSRFEQSDPVNALLSFYNGDDAASLPSSAVDSAWTTQTGQTGWSITDPWPVGNSFDSADVASRLQAVVDRAGYVAGNKIMMFFNYNPAGSSGFRWAYNTPTLHATYST